MNNGGDNVLTAIIGVVGTLLGVILGWCLNVLSNKGKLIVYLSSWTESFQCFDNCAFRKNSTSQSETELLCYDCSLDVFNSSSYTKIMRNIKIVFCNGRREILCDIPQDQKTRKAGASNTVMPQNIPPHTVVNLKLSSTLSIKDNNLFEIFNTDSIYFEYCNEKNQKRRVPLKKVDYGNYFENQTDLSE